jgi:hypothetical protein
MGNLPSKTRSQELKIEKSCQHSSSCSFDAKILEICQEGCLMISSSTSKMGYLGSKTRSQELKIENKLVDTLSGCSFDPIFLEISQEHSFDDLEVKFEHG